MNNKDKNLSRREFIRKAGAAGLTSFLALSSGMIGGAIAQEEKKEEKKEGAEEKKSEIPKMPLRTFGKTGVQVSILSMGGITDLTTNQILLQKGLDWGATYWDTANGYSGGNSELGIGKYFEKNPEARKKIFLVTKGGARKLEELTRMLNLSLERMKTDYIDLYFLHAVKNPADLTPELKAWAEKAKKDKKIKFFGFSSHSNMEKLLQHAATLGWIDGIMTVYNYRIMHEDEMKKGIEACHKAGIGLTAMKTQGGGSIKTDSEEELKLAGHFLKKGFTPHQAKIKAIWENPTISAVCSAMYNLTVLQSNVAAAVDKTKLDLTDLSLLKSYAQKTCSGYCAGCSEICSRAMKEDAPIADVMRYMMYNNYGDISLAREEFAHIPEDVRARLASLDYSAAERVCPRKIAIGKIMSEAARILA
ncbi:aldo/keto reductase [Candidatus Sumerlaeota bacterium]|nr:aldo/keto reductase [Candidatus Sumerlaeota bacterium]